MLFMAIHQINYYILLSYQLIFHVLMLNYLYHFIYQILNPFLLFLLNVLTWLKKKKLGYFNVFLIIIIPDFIIIKDIIFIK